MIIRFVFQIIADSVIIFPLYRSMKLLAEYNDHPVYFYMFTYQGRYSFSMWNETTPYGIFFSFIFTFTHFVYSNHL